MATFTIEITPDSSNGTIAHAVGKFSGGSSSYKGQRRMNVTVSGVGTFSALSPETSGGENTFSLDITGLTPGTTYNWSASLYYKNTSGGWVTAGSQYDKTGSLTTKRGAAAAHKTLINGTAYEVNDGKCMVGGTVYNILKGRTLIGGTGYDVTFSNEASLVWHLNGTVSLPFKMLRANFSTVSMFGGTDTWTGIMPGEDDAGLDALCYMFGTNNSEVVYHASEENWVDNAYQDITFTEPPERELLAWLEVNGIPQQRRKEHNT